MNYFILHYTGIVHVSAPYKLLFRISFNLKFSIFIKINFGMNAESVVLFQFCSFKIFTIWAQNLAEISISKE